MESNLGENRDIALMEMRLVLIGGRWDGKSSSGNTILGKERFECGRTRTSQCEVRHEVVEGRKLTVVDVPGWSSSYSLTEISEKDKLSFKLNASYCPPGPNAFLLVIPIDCAFTVKQRRTVEEHMKLLGERVWRYTMVLFTCKDFLGKKTIEQHIESEGDALKWIIERCNNRYHVINNKDSNSSQVTRLLEKMDEMVWHNNSSYYELDEQTIQIIKKKQQEVAERAEKRRKKAEEQSQQMKTLIPEERKHIPKLQVVLLGSRGVGKTSVGNTILGIKQEDGKRTAHSVAQHGLVGKTEITLVDTPGWWKGFPVFDTPEMIKEEVMSSMFLCPPGPHIFLLVIDADASFTERHLEAVTTHVDLLGEGVWGHTIVVFTRGDWLGSNPIEEYIEGEGEALQSLVEKCDNRYHVLSNKNADDGTQVIKLLEKITETVAGSHWKHFVPDEQIRLTIEKKRRRVEEAARLRQSQVEAKRQTLRGSSNKLQELKMLMLSQKTFGKSATGNILLRKEVFPTCQNEHSQVEEAEVDGRLVTVIDTPGWWKKSSDCTEEIDKEIVRGLTQSPLGVHAVLLVVPLDLTFRDVQQVALQEQMNLFDASIWKHAMVVFTYGDKLADRSVEEHIEREHRALQWLVDKCENRYHVLNNMKKRDLRQVTELFEKIEEMVSVNSGRLFCPDMNDTDLRIKEKFSRWQLKHVLRRRLEQEYKRRELELMSGFRKTLLGLQDDIRGKQLPSTKLKSLTKGIGQRKKEENIDEKITREIAELDKAMMKSTEHLQSSMDVLFPDLSGDSPASSIAEFSPDKKKSTNKFDKVLGWLSTLQIGRNVENQLTLNFSETSGYRSVIPHDEFDFDVEADIAE